MKETGLQLSKEIEMSNKTMIFGKPPRMFLDRIPVESERRSWGNENFGTGQNIKSENDNHSMHNPVIFRFEAPGAGKPQTGTQVVDSKAPVKV
jgi:hypothetical protein